MRALSLFIIITFPFISFISAAESEYITLPLKVFPEDYEVYSYSTLYRPVSAEGNTSVYRLPSEESMLYIRSTGFRDKYLLIPGEDKRGKADRPDSGNGVWEIKLERIDTRMKFLDFIPTGSQPKSIEFSPDGEYMSVALLNGRGVEIYSREDMELYRRLYPPDKWSSKKGFVETVFFSTREELWVSQMTTGMIHVFDTSDWSYKLSFDCGGGWPKVITLNSREDTAFISNWESRNISVIDTDNYTVLGVIPVNGIPRGMAVSGDQRILYAANFTSGDINKIDIDKMELIGNIDLGDGALRHIVISDDKKRLYVSDMYYGTVSVVNTDTEKVEKSFYAGSNINTIKILTGRKMLFISSRGRNSENGYLQKGPVFGKVYLYDISAGKITDWTWGGNQPTGLAVSPLDNTIAFTDFLDHRIELYRLDDD